MCVLERVFSSQIGSNQMILAILAEKTGLNLSAHLAFRAPRGFLTQLKPKLEHLGVLKHESATGLYFTDSDGNSLEVTCWREHALQAAGQAHW